jgi:UDP-galactopyranose mutase
MTALTYEYPAAEGDPYYPIPRPENQALYKSYQRLAGTTSDVWFVGRLATYRYYNMDQIVGQALMTFERINQSLPHRTAPRSVSLPGAGAEARLDA